MSFLNNVTKPVNNLNTPTTNKYKNGFVATWRDYRVNAGTSDVYAQKIDSLGHD